MKKLILLFKFIFIVILIQGQEVAEYDEYYINNSLIFGEKSAVIPLQNGLLFYYDNGVDTNGLCFFDGTLLHNLIPSEKLSLGTEGEIPYMNAGGTNFEYTDSFKFTPSGGLWLKTSDENYNTQLIVAPSIIFRKTEFPLLNVTTSESLTAFGYNLNFNNNGNQVDMNMNTDGIYFSDSILVSIIGKLEVTDTIKAGHLVVDSNLHALHQIQLAVKDCVDIVTTGVWLDIKMDTLFADNSTTGLFELTEDSTGIICRDFTCVYPRAKVVLTNNSPGSVSANVKFVLYKNDKQLPLITTNITRSWASGGSATIVAPSLSFDVEKNDTLFVKAKFENANIDVDFPDEDIQPKFPFILEIQQNPKKL